MRNVNSDQASPRSAIDEAARWFLRLQEDSANAETFLEWQRWLSASSTHRSAYEEIEDTVLRLSRGEAKPALPYVEELARDSYDGSQSIAEWKARRTPAPAQETARPQTRRWQAIAAGFMTVAVASAWLWIELGRDERVGAFAYQTKPGQRQVVRLPDGSNVTLDADSQLEVLLRPKTRALTLKRGEAFFEVAKDRKRPFVVQVGTAQVIAVGTAFNVRMSENRTVVAVTEGRVDVVTGPHATDLSTQFPGVSRRTALRLTAHVSAGQAVSYFDDGNLKALPATEVPLATTWREGRRQYRNEPLRYVLADVDRYTDHRIEIVGRAGDLRFTGTVDLANSQSWLRGLPVALPVKITERADGTLSVIQVDKNVTLDPRVERSEHASQ